MARRTRLHHDRRPSISLLLLSLLCADRQREQTRESTGGHQPASPRSASHYRLELTLAPKIKRLHRREWLSIERFTLSQTAAKGTWVRPAIRSKISSTALHANLIKQGLIDRSSRKQRDHPGLIGVRWCRLDNAFGAGRERNRNDES